jgi:hypothetical protein
MADVVASIRTSAADELAGFMSMHDLAVTTTPIPAAGPIDVIWVRPQPFGVLGSQVVLIEHWAATGRDDLIVRPAPQAVSLFWRFAYEKWGIEAVPQGGQWRRRRRPWSATPSWLPWPRTLLDVHDRRQIRMPPPGGHISCSYASHVEPPTPRSLVAFVRSVAVLALPAEAQLVWAGQLLDQDVPLIDELALEFDYGLGLVPTFVEREWISASALPLLTELDHQLNDMSGEQNARLWEPDAVTSRPEWHRVRALARAALTQLG